jgi:hypothetical protein
MKVNIRVNRAAARLMGTLSKAKDFVADGNIQWPNGRLPINTAGGNLGEAYIHGFGNIVEAVRQVRGESTCQVEGAELSLSVSGPNYAPGSALLFGPG